MIIEMDVDFALYLKQFDVSVNFTIKILALNQIGYWSIKTLDKHTPTALHSCCEESSFNHLYFIEDKGKIIDTYYYKHRYDHHYIMINSLNELSVLINKYKNLEAFI